MYNYRPPGRHSIPPTVKTLIGINVAMFALTFILPPGEIFYTHLFGMHYPASEKFHFFQVITHMFMHGGLTHLFFNMFALYMFGRVLEAVWGPKRFLIYYFVTGLGAVCLHTFVNYLEISSLQKTLQAFINTPSPDLFAEFIREHVGRPQTWVMNFMGNWFDDPDNPTYIAQATQILQTEIQRVIDIPTIGASGAVFGILLAFGVLFPNTQLMLIFPPIPIKAKYFVLGYGA